MVPRRNKEAYGFVNDPRFIKTFAAIAKVGGAKRPAQCVTC